MTAARRFDANDDGREESILNTHFCVCECVSVLVTMSVVNMALMGYTLLNRN